MKKVKCLLLSPFLLAIILVITAFTWWRINSQPLSVSSEKVTFVITKGSSVSQIGNKLKEREIIKSALAFKLYLQVSGNSKKIQAGEYELSADKSLSEIVKEFLNGPSQLWVTIPEGLRREEIALRYAEVLGKKDNEYTLFVDEFLNLSSSKEGFLFPDTYLVPKDVSAQKVINLMINTFDSKIATLKSLVSDSSYSLDKIITVASLVERETKTDEERPLVAGVIYNRLDIGMGLQIDATLQYALASSKMALSSRKLNEIKFWETLTSEDKKMDSLYNTYKYNGLPPTPICSPGLSSIKAALEPEESDYLYYLHDLQGQVHFAMTLEEHNANIRKYLND